MIKLIQTRPESRDCTAPYDVKFDKPYTIGELVNEVLTTRRNGWGDFEVREGGSWFKPTICRVDYRYGKLMGELPEDIAKLPIVRATAYGGWSAMDYNIIVEKQ